MTIITTVTGKRIRFQRKEPGPKLLPEGVKKRRVNICLSPHWHEVGKEKATARSLSFSEFLEELIYRDSFGSRLLMQATAMAVVLFIVAACRAIPTPDSTPTPQIVATRLTAEVYGKLVHVDDCLRVNTDYGTSYLLVWPPGFVVDSNGDTIRVADTITGEESGWHVGDMVWLGGGEVSNLDEQTRQSVPRHCPGPYWVAGGLEMPGTVRNLVLFLEFEGAKVEFTDEATDQVFSVVGKAIIVNEERVSVYEFVNEEAAEAEVALVSPDGFSIAREQGVRHINWLGTPHFYQRGRLIVIYVNGNAKVRDWLEAFMGPQFAGGD